MSRSGENRLQGVTARGSFRGEVPDAQKELLKKFRSTHPAKSLDAEGVRWRYITGGSTGPTLLLLPGAIGKAEVAFHHVLEFENDFRVIAPDYPPVFTVKQMLRGFVRILDEEDAGAVAVVGGSLGGGLAQCMVRLYPERVRRLVLSQTGVPNPKRAKMSGIGLPVLRLLPMGLMRSGLVWEVSKMLAGAGAEKRFWVSYFKELASKLTKEELVATYRRAIDLETNYRFAADDLKQWPGEILIVESVDDTLIRPAERAALKSLYPRAQVHTFESGGHGASILRREEYLAVVGEFLRRG